LWIYIRKFDFNFFTTQNILVWNLHQQGLVNIDGQVTLHLYYLLIFISQFSIASSICESLMFVNMWTCIYRIWPKLIIFSCSKPLKSNKLCWVDEIGIRWLFFVNIWSIICVGVKTINCTYLLLCQDENKYKLTIQPTKTLMYIKFSNEKFRKTHFFNIWHFSFQIVSINFLSTCSKCKFKVLFFCSERLV
jgi:hypothetical protein